MCPRSVRRQLVGGGREPNPLLLRLIFGTFLAREAPLASLAPSLCGIISRDAGKSTTEVTPHTGPVA